MPRTLTLRWHQIVKNGNHTSVDRTGGATTLHGPQILVFPGFELKNQS